MTLTLYRVFVGSNNETHKLEREKIKRIADKRFKGYTFINAVGRWNGTQEKTAVIEILTEEHKDVILTARELKRELKQEAVLIQQLKTDTAFI